MVPCAFYGTVMSFRLKIRHITEAGLKEIIYACICLILSFFEARHMIIRCLESGVVKKQPPPSRFLLRENDLNSAQSYLLSL